MRTIHSRRMFRFLFLRPTYACFHARCTASTARRHMRRRPATKPLANASTRLRRRRALNPRLARGMASAASVGQEALDADLILGGHDLRAPQLADPIGVLLRQDMVLVARLALGLAGRGEPEALLRAAVRLHLGHGRPRGV